MATPIHTYKSDFLASLAHRDWPEGDPRWSRLETAMAMMSYQTAAMFGDVLFEGTAEALWSLMDSVSTVSEASDHQFGDYAAARRDIEHIAGCLDELLSRTADERSPIPVPF